jgi:hypothetical protein
MSTIRLKRAEECNFTISFHGNLDGTNGRVGYEADVNFTNDENGWKADVVIDGMGTQDSPENAADRLHLYLLAMAKAVKGKNIKHLKIATMFNHVIK